MKIKASPFKWNCPSDKQLKILNWWVDGSGVEDKDLIIADGAVRSGKTLPMSFSFVSWAMNTFDDQFLGMSGKTIASFRRNVLTDLKKTLFTEGYEIEEKRSENLLIIKFEGKTNTFHIFGGNDERSQDLIQGVTLAGMLFDEVVLMPESFVNQAVARCSVDGSKLFFNCNPEGPYHWFKLNWIDKIEEKNGVYLHFTQEDNPSLTERIKARYRSIFSGIFFQRFILGLWVLAQGIIYDCFDSAKHIVDSIPAGRVTYYVGVDYGTGNPTVFLLLAHHLQSNKLYLIDEYYYDSRKTGRQKTDAEYSKDLQEFIKGRYPQSIFVDPSALSFITQLKRDGVKNIKQADNAVIDGIRTVASAFTQEFLFLLKEKCLELEKEFASYVWDEKAAQHGEDRPVKQFDHCCDCLRYIIKSQFSKLINKPVNKPRGC